MSKTAYYLAYLIFYIMRKCS